MKKKRTAAPQKTGAGPGALRLIGGQYRGRKLPIAEVEGLRPTGDRLREVLFNWLQFELPGALVLDLFAGSGALGLEALSRGAERVWLIEKHPRAAAQLRASAADLDCPALVVEGDVLAWLARTEVMPVDGVFLDPPFAADLWAETLQALLQQGWLKPGAWLYVEAPVRHVLALPAELKVVKEKRAGEVMMRLLRYQAAN